MSDSHFCILAEIRRSHRERGFGPTFLEIVERLGWISSSYPFEVARVMRGVGLINVAPRNMSRTLCLTPAGERALALEEFRRAVRSGGMVPLDDLNPAVLPALEVS